MKIDLQTMIKIENVSFGYIDGQETLHDVNLSVRKGECILLCGESGCGKTTATKLINGLIPHFTEGCTLKGDVWAAGFPVADTELYELAKHIGSVFQNPKSQFFNLDTDSELFFGLENEGADPDYMEERIQTVVSTLQIGRLLNRGIFSLSGGEKQSLAFASVYAMNPDIYILDEPTANLDREAICRLREQITFLKKQGSTIVIAEHRLYFLSDLIDHAVYFQNGRIIRHFSGEEFRGLSDSSRVEMGLRTLRESAFSLPEARTTDHGKGLMVEGLACGYKKEAAVFENLTFAVMPGEVLAVTGCNGTGKTTLVRCLCGLLKEWSGRISFYGKRLNAKARLKESFLVMQDVNHQLFYDSVWNECEQAACREVQQARIKDVLERFGLLGLKDRHPMSLSGGQKQRLAVATALLSDKKLLVFDEPTSGLDYRQMVEVSKVIRDLADRGHMILVVSHDREFMEMSCDRILEIGQERGRSDGHSFPDGGEKCKTGGK